ncbi:MAG: zinc-ribbon domain-containing protein, partial [Holophagales bacterium]|nr:zinc-ribbon domain-containing protein [Holophagales bacterium]
MPEVIKCPNCSTKYSLRPERVTQGVKRVRCFRCGLDFGVEETVSRLLGINEDSASSPPFALAIEPVGETPSDLAPVVSDDDLSAQPEAEVIEPAPAMADDLGLSISDDNLLSPPEAEVIEPPAPALADDLGLAISDDDLSAQSETAIVDPTPALTDEPTPAPMD